MDNHTDKGQAHTKNLMDQQANNPKTQGQPVVEPDYAHTKWTHTQTLNAHTPINYERKHTRLNRTKHKQWIQHKTNNAQAGAHPNDRHTNIG